MAKNVTGYDLLARSGATKIAPSRAHRNDIKFYTVGEVAEMLHVAARTVRRWIDGGELVVHRFHRAVRIAESDLRAFLAVRREA